MSTETILTNEEIIAIGHRASAIEAGENGYILPIEFARAIEQAILQSPKVQALRKDANNVRGWKEAVIAWEVCASIHQEWAKGKDALFNTRQADFIRNAEEARTAYRTTEQAIEQSPEIQALKRDKERLDWLAGPNNNIGNVQLPRTCVERNLHSLRAAIDDAMEYEK